MVASDSPTGVRALSERGPSRFVLFAALYVVQGVPAGFISVAIVAWLAARGASTESVGTVAAIAGIPWATKLVWGPLVDRFRRSAMGARRPWILGAQAALVLCALALASLREPAQHLDVLAWVLFAQAICTTLQDVAVDALAIDTFAPAELGRANAYMFVGKICGYAAGGAGLSLVLARSSLARAALLEAACVAVLACVPLLVRERRGDRLLSFSSSAGAPSAGGERFPLRRFARAVAAPASRRAALLMLLAVPANVGVAAVFKVHAVQQLGWSDTELTRAVAAYGSLAALAGAAAASQLAGRVRLHRLLAGVAAALALSAAIFAASVDLWTSAAFVRAYIVVDAALVAAAFVGMNALCMELTDARFAASHYAVFMAAQNGGIVLGNRMAGALDRALPLPQLFVALAAVNAGAAALALTLRGSARESTSA